MSLGGPDHGTCYRVWGLRPGYEVESPSVGSLVPTFGRRWNTSINVYDHLGVLLEVADLERAQYLNNSGEYIATGTKKRVEALVHHGPPDGRQVSDEHAMKPKGSQRPVFREKAYSGRQWWTLKHQRGPWGGKMPTRTQPGPSARHVVQDGELTAWERQQMADLNPGHETPSTGGPDI